MPEAIENIYDAIVTIVSGALTEHKRLANAYDLTQNDALRLSRGYAVGVGAGENTRRLVGGTQSWRRNYVVTLTNSVPIALNQAAKHESIEKSILVAHSAVKNAFHNNITLSGTVSNSTVVSDSGINFIGGEQGQMFLFLEITLEVEYFEQPEAA